jgi:hypothetical protein
LLLLAFCGEQGHSIQWHSPELELYRSVRLELESFGSIVNLRVAAGGTWTLGGDLGNFA